MIKQTTTTNSTKIISSEMSVVCCNGHGVVIDQLKSLNAMYNCPVICDGVVNCEDCYQYQPDFFYIGSPYMCDSKFEKMKEESIIGGHAPRKRKKKRKLDLNEGELELINFHSQVGEVLRRGLEELVALARQSGYLLPTTSPPPDNNLVARNMARLASHGPDLAHQCDDMPPVGYGRPVSLDDVKVGATLFNRLVHYDGENVCKKHLLDTDFILPPRCSFLMSDIKHIQQLLHEDIMYDLIVMDPPWFNKSAKRKKTYSMVYDNDLLNLPVPALAKQGCLIVTWATNKQQQHHFIQNDMFPKWGVKFIARWQWLKVTKHGETICNLDDNQKKPYETLFLGYVCTKNTACDPVHYVTRHAHDPATSQTKDLVTSEAKDHVTDQTKDLMSSKTRYHVISETKDDVISATKDHVTSETKDHVTSETKDHVIRETKDHVTSETMDHVISETNDHVTSETKNHVASETKDHVTGQTKDHATSETKDHVTHAFKKDHNLPGRFQNIPENYIVLSTPSSVHSQKPNLQEVLMPYLPEKPRCLELFARSLQSDWVCWGNEVLSLQQVQNFTNSRPHLGK